MTYYTGQSSTLPDSGSRARRGLARNRSRRTGLTTFMGWFGIGLGIGELVAGDRLAAALGLDGKAQLLRGYGAREIASGLLCFAAPGVGIGSRILGDVLDIATLAPGVSKDGAVRRNSLIALGAVGGATLLDVAAAARLRDR